MIRYIIRRILWAGVLMVAVTMVTFVIFFVIPADPATLVAGKGARPIDVQRAAHFIGTDRPVPVQYAMFVQRLTGVGWHDWHPTEKTPSLGTSFATRQDV